MRELTLYQRPDRATVGDFLESSIGVLRTFGITAAAASPVPGLVVTRQIDLQVIAVLIATRGDLSGMTWQFPFEVTRQIAAVFAPELELDAELLEGAAAELANVLAGRGLAALESHGFQLEIAPPQITPTARGGVSAQLITQLGTIIVVFHGNVPPL